jgi:hypothetical protein
MSGGVTTSTACRRSPNVLRHRVALQVRTTEATADIACVGLLLDVISILGTPEFANTTSESATRLLRSRGHYRAGAFVERHVGWVEPLANVIGNISDLVSA